mmetsp:Transcript_22652/g.57875  ORF Transcript_22652/g.57875 Transcript_22652/m.57875 type:complete len:86 (+) Transcript_22652:1808-2065(+)
MVQVQPRVGVRLALRLEGSVAGDGSSPSRAWDASCPPTLWKGCPSWCRSRLAGVTDAAGRFCCRSGVPAAAPLAAAHQQQSTGAI